MTEQQREAFFSKLNIELSKGTYNLAKNIDSPRKIEGEQLDNWGKILGLQRLENESDEDFRKRLSEKLPGKVM